METVRVINWLEPSSNDFFLVSQFWFAGNMYTRRPDLVGFVNGIPLLLSELAYFCPSIIREEMFKYRSCKSSGGPIDPLTLLPHEEAKGGIANKRFLEIAQCLHRQAV